MAEPLVGHTRLSAPLLAAALNRAQIRAWSALSEPVPGTMLSVLEAAARAAGECDSAHNGDDSNQALALPWTPPSMPRWMLWCKPRTNSHRYTPRT
ncbi:glycerone kinase [Arthrobacter sp. Hiyo8]|nr:glycerone kinase [Arthrobacter sp. Hiyo8]